MAAKLTKPAAGPVYTGAYPAYQETKGKNKGGVFR